MITKIGLDILSPAIGMYRASNLSPDDVEVLKKHYGLPGSTNDTSLILRNAGRGFAGGLIGGTAGAAAGLIPAMISRNPMAAALPGIGALAGYAYGVKKGTDKYSVGNAAALRNSN